MYKFYKIDQMSLFREHDLSLLIGVVFFRQIFYISNKCFIPIESFKSSIGSPKFYPEIKVDNSQIKKKKKKLNGNIIR